MGIFAENWCKSLLNTHVQGQHTYNSITLHDPNTDVASGSFNVLKITLGVCLVLTFTFGIVLAAIFEFYLDTIIW